MPPNTISDIAASLHLQFAAVAVSLDDALRMIATDWQAVYRQNGLKPG